MCFYHGDCNWYASVNDETEGPASEKVRCDECGDWIHKGEWVRHVYQQEREYCECCVDEDGDEDYEKECCKDGGECDFGETFDYNCCERCDKVLRAIRVVEEEAGCKGNETQPALTQLSDAMWDEGERYGDRSRELYPEVAAHLGRFSLRDADDEWEQVDLDPVDELGGEA